VTAFAAIFSRDGRPICREGSDRIAAALASMTGAESRLCDAGPCRLFLAPLHAWDPREPIARRGSPIAAAGQVTLEGAADLRRETGLPASAPDLEVAAAVLERWGVDGARRLQGEYALAAWDERERSLVCARDGIGIRVLYVGEARDLVVVSNTIDAVVAHPAISRTLDEGALLRFLADGSVTKTTATPYKAVKLAPEGHTLVIRSEGDAILRRHWHPPAMDHVMARDVRSVPEGYRATLQHAVADRVSGRRATIFLSGGLDSTTIASTAIECAADLRAVTFRYRGLDFDDEVRLAAEAAAHLGIETSIVDADEQVALEAERSGQTSAVLADEPGLANWRRGLERAAQFSSLALYGEDGDALLAPPGGAALLDAQGLGSVALAAVKLIASEGEAPYLGLRLRERIGWAPSPRVEPTPWLTRTARDLVAQPEDASVLGARADPLEFGPEGGRTWERLLRNVPRDFAVSLSPDVTRQRLEVTLPLMDTRVIRYVLSIPPVPWCHHKRVAREAFAGRLPASILDRPKTSVPGAHEALVGSWRERYEDVARDPQTASHVAHRGWIDAATWRHTIAHGSAQAAMAAWRVLILDAWLRRAGTSCTR
jgi:asparagine synthase (glutamine-hydrolysing)